MESSPRLRDGGPESLSKLLCDVREEGASTLLEALVRRTPLSVDVPGRCEPEVPFEEQSTEQLSLGARQNLVKRPLF